MFTTVGDLINTLSKYPLDTPIFGQEEEWIADKCAIQGAAGTDREVTQLFIHWHSSNELYLGDVPQTGDTLFPALCDND